MSAIDRAKAIVLGWVGPRPCVHCRLPWVLHVRRAVATCAHYAPMDRETHLRAVFPTCIEEIYVDEGAFARRQQERTER